MRLALTLFAICAALLSIPAHASDAALEDQFALDAKGHGRALNDLYSMRGLNPMEFEDADIEMVKRWLAEQRIDRSPGYPEGTAILFYAHEGDRLAIYLINTSGIIAQHIVTITPDDLREATLAYRLDLEVDGIDRSRAPIWRGSDGAEPAFPITRSEASWEVPINEILLPEPILTQLQDVRHLIIVGNGAVATNPFSAFPLSKDAMLVDQMSVTVAPSLFDIDQMIRPWAPDRDFRRALLVGDPLVPATEDWKVPRLPGAMEEIERMSTRSQGTTLLGEDATKASVVPLMGRSSILYFAAHGLSNPREPLTGGFQMLAGPSPDEAFLTASEVQKMRLRANLVVLSACQSGLGYNHDGGVIGLARSFQKAGVPRVVMSLWSVSDEATLYLMDRFQIEAQTHVPAEALRLAMLAAREKYPDPALWAGFTLFGTPR